MDMPIYESISASSKSHTCVAYLTPKPGLLKVTDEPIMPIFDLRSLNTSDRASTPNDAGTFDPDDDDLQSLGSYAQIRPIPKMDKKVEQPKLQHEFEIKTLCRN